MPLDKILLDQPICLDTFSLGSLTGKHLKILTCIKIIAAQGPHLYKDMSDWELGYKIFFSPQLQMLRNLTVSLDYAKALGESKKCNRGNKFSHDLQI